MRPQRVRRATHPQILQGKTHQRQTALRLSAVNAARATVTAATVANAMASHAWTTVTKTPWPTTQPPWPKPAAKTALPCWNVDTQVIWDAFRAFNRARGNEQVPAGYLLGFMRKWRSAVAPAPTPEPARSHSANELEAAALMRLAPVKNWRFHERDMERRIGREAYAERVSAMQARLGLNRFAAALAVHGEAVRDAEIRV